MDGINMFMLKKSAIDTNPEYEHKNSTILAHKSIELIQNNLD